MKAALWRGHSSGEVISTDIDPAAVPSAVAASDRENRAILDVTSIHAAHADFVWRSLYRLGVREADLPDMLQEVFVVVHRRLHTLQTEARVTTWLFGIAMRVASHYRRRAHRRRERAVPEFDALETQTPSPERVALESDARKTLERILDRMSLDKRAVFVMFELEELGCDEIATIVGVPTGTVYSRLHVARREFAQLLRRHQADSDREAGL